MRDLRRYAAQTRNRLIIWGVMIIIVIGEILIYLFYGTQSAIFGLLCMLVGLFPLLLIFLVLWGLDQIVKRMHDQD
jgi:uncharacterized membrane protein YhaH (DUF805 family)